MAELLSPGEEIIKAHTTEEVIRYLSKESRTLWSRVNSEEDIDKAVVRNFANIGLIFGYLWALDKKVNGEEEPVVL